MLEIYVLLFVLILAVAVELQKLIPESSCTGDCDQGRRCDCVQERKNQ